MKRDEFKRRLEKLESHIYRGLMCYTVWEGLWPTEETLWTLTRYRDFLSPSRGALFEMLLSHFTAVLDEEENPSCLQALLRMAQNEEKVLAPWARGTDLPDMVEQVERDGTTLVRLIQVKEQHLVQLDARPLEDMTLRKGEVDNFVKGVLTTFGKLSFAHDGSRHHWSPQVQRAEWVTGEVLRILGDDSVQRRRGPDM